MGDVIKVGCYDEYSVLYLHMGLMHRTIPMNPLFHYHCPMKAHHKLELFFSRNNNLDPKYAALIRELPENGCGHYLR